RVQVGIPGLSTYGSAGKPDDAAVPENRRTRTWEPRAYVRTLPRLFEHLRKQLGDDVELLHDVHERIPPTLALQLCRDLEKYHLYFLEDPLSPEDVGWFTHLRQQTSTPLAMGELFNNPNEWLPLVSGRLIDFIRIHISQVGGLTMARKVVALCEFFAVRTIAFYTVADYHGGSPIPRRRATREEVRPRHRPPPARRHQLPAILPARAA